MQCTILCITKLSRVYKDLEDGRIFVGCRPRLHANHCVADSRIQLHEIRALPKTAHGTGQPLRISKLGHYALHAKLYILDRQSLFIDSFNFDQRSKHLNTEIGLFIDNAPMALNAANRFNDLVDLNTAYAVTFDGPDARSIRWRSDLDGTILETSHEPARDAWQRFKARCFRVFPLNGEL